MNNIKYIYRIVRIVMSLTIFLGLGACSSDDVQPSNDNPLNVGISTRGITGNTVAGVKISSIRIIAADSQIGYVVFNKTTSTGLTDSGATSEIGNFTATLKPGSYNIYVIANETPAMTAILQNLVNASQMAAIKIDASFVEPDLVMFSKTTVSLRPKNNNVSETDGEIQIDGVGAWINTLAVTLERVAVKVSLNMKKNTTTAADVVVIKKVEVVQVPLYCYLMSKVYDGISTQTQIMYDSPTGITLSANSATPVDIGVPIIIPELRLTSPSNSSTAAVIQIYATYQGNNVTYKIPVRGNLSIENYDLLRDSHYSIHATIETGGDLNYNPYVEYVVKDWSDPIGGGTDLSQAVVFNGSWTFGQNLGSNTFGVYNNGYVEYKFNLTQPLGATWTASLSNGLNFGFDNTGGAVSSGIAGAGDQIIRIKPLQTVSVSGVQTKFFVFVNTNSTYTKIDLTGSSNDYTVTQIPQ